MLIRFSVENYRSFRDEATLSMLKTRERNNPHHVNSDKSGQFQTLRGAVIYGANACGKSNLINAMAFAQRFIVENKADTPLSGNSFILDDTKSKAPSSFHFEFKIEGKAYAYGFEATGKRIISEWLDELTKHTETLIFMREKKQQGSEKANIHFGPWIKTLSPEQRNELATLAKSTPDDTLFLYDAKQRHLHYRELAKPLEWFTDKLIIITTNTLMWPYVGISLKESLERSLQAIDTGITGLEFIDLKGEKDFLPEVQAAYSSFYQEKLKEGESKHIGFLDYPIIISKNNNKLHLKRMQLVTTHKKTDGSNIHFDRSDESDGTQRLIKFLPVLLDPKTKDSVLVIDELERSLHPKITLMLHDFHFNHQDRTNAQLILATHEILLINTHLYRRDEIWFVEKDDTGASTLYSLNEFNQRYDKDLQKDYFLGRYGAIPRIGTL